MKILKDNISRIVGVLAIILPIGVSLFIFQKEMSVSTLDKYVEKHENPVTFPLRDLSSLTQGERPQIAIADPAYTTIAAKTVFLRNIGIAPIKPTDFVEPLTVSVSSGWSIISIRERYPLTWHRDAPDRFRADPFLMNPDDRIVVTAYLNSDQEFSSSSEADESIDLEVQTRIVGLKGFSERPSTGKPLSIWDIYPLVHLTPRQLVLLMFIAIALLYWQVRAIDRADLTRSLNVRAALIVLSGVLSFAVAEVLVFFGSGGTDIYKIALGREYWALKIQWPNWLVLLISALWSSFLLYRSWKSASQRRRSPVILP